LSPRRSIGSRRMRRSIRRSRICHPICGANDQAISRTRCGSWSTTFDERSTICSSSAGTRTTRNRRGRMTTGRRAPRRTATESGANVSPPFMPTHARSPSSRSTTSAISRPGSRTALDRRISARCSLPSITRPITSGRSWPYGDSRCVAGGLSALLARLTRGTTRAVRCCRVLRGSCRVLRGPMTRSVFGVAVPLSPPGSHARISANSPSAG